MVFGIPGNPCDQGVVRFQKKMEESMDSKVTGKQKLFEWNEGRKKKEEGRRRKKKKEGRKKKKKKEEEEEGRRRRKRTNI